MRVKKIWWWGVVGFRFNEESGEKISDIKKFYNERESDKKLWNKGERWVIATKFNL